MNCDEFAIVSGVECLLHVFAENHRSLLTVGGIISLCWYNALTGQADVPVAEI